MSKVLNSDVFENKEIEKKWKKIERILSSIFKSVNSPAFEKENVRFLDSLDFENLPDFPTRRDVR